MSDAISMQGFDTLLSKLEEMGKEGKKIENTVLKQAGEVLAKEMRKNAPVDTGNLRDNIEVSKVKKNKEGSYIQVGTNKESWYGMFVEFGRSGQSANPFMSRAFETKQKEIQDTIANSIKEALGL